MTTETDTPQAYRRFVRLNNLFLDPNNFRFRDDEEYVFVEESRIQDPDIQRRTQAFLTGRGQEHILDLIHSFRVNGWLPVDNIQVRELGGGRFLVLEGNRRVAALKSLQRKYEDGGTDLGRLDPSVFGRVPVILYADGEREHFLVLMGLKHISGNKKWSGYNQALLMRQLSEEHHLGADEVCKAVGLNMREFNLALRSLDLVEAYKRSDYGDQFKTEKFNLFREILKSPPIRSWLDWSDEARRAGNANNLQRLFSWLSQERGGSTEEEEDAQPALEPAITTGTQVRELARLVTDDLALLNLDTTRSLAEASLASVALKRDKVRNALDLVAMQAEVLFSFSGQLQGQQLDEVEDLANKLHALRLAAGRRESAVRAMPRWERPTFQTARASCFCDVGVVRYRGLSELSLSGLRSLNLVVGANNCGKTTLLEAIYLLAQMGDPDAVQDVIRRRFHLAEIPSLRLAEELPEDFSLTATFDDLPSNGVSVKGASRLESDDSPFLGAYLKTFRTDASYLGEASWSETRLFRDRAPRVERKGQKVLCPTVFSSPFSSHDPDELKHLWERGVEAGLKSELLSFFKSTLERGLLDINLANDLGQFLVSHEDLERPLDLSNFGEGLRRMFHMGLVFAYARGGVALFDEFENALHTSLLRPFTLLVEDLSARFKVQVFATTHSKECIDAFLLNGSSASNVALFGIAREGEGRVVRRMDGEQARRLVELSDLDFRTPS